MNEQEFSYWLTFDRLRGVGLGSKRISLLYEHFGSLKLAWHADRADLLQVQALPVSSIDKFLQRRDEYSLEESLELLDRYDIKAFTRLSPDYPSQCLQLSSPPLILYVKGRWDLSWLSKAIAMVGTRQASQYGFDQTLILSSQLSSLGFAVISGIAAGIDEAAHSGALKSKTGGCSIAVVASGVDQIVPQRSKIIYQLLCEKGAIVSEYPPGTLPERGFFPARNRIIAALSQAVLVSEAGEQSGALITAQRAFELNKQVFCLAGRADNPVSKGGHWWVRKGRAKLITCYEDVLEEMGYEKEQLINSQQIISETDLLRFGYEEQKAISPPSPEMPIEIAPKKKEIDLAELGETERTIYQILKQGQSLTIDQLVEQYKLPIGKINSALLKLTFKEIIKRKGREILLL